MEDKEQLKKDRARLHQIYVEHDLGAFRAFLKDKSASDERVRPYVDTDDETLNKLMHAMKAKLIYLGESWQESRNFLRKEQFWKGADVSTLPACAACNHFREAPTEDGSPCMHLGAIPSDIACPGHSELPKNKAKRP